MLNMRERLKKAWPWVRHHEKTEDQTTPLLPLTPQYDPRKHSVYFDAIDTALNSPDRPVLNVALTGSYGVGKSSILEEVARRHERKVIAISLSTLGFPEEADSQSEETAKKTTKTNSIQQEIVKQLLYSQDPVKMPGSRYRRMTRFRFWRELVLAALFAVPVTLAFLLTGWTASLAELIPLPTEWSLLIHGVVFAGAALLIVGFRAKFHNRIQVDKITAGSTTISLSAGSSTYFDEYLDEIVYFFEVSKRDIVIFEDIDRFDDAHIFETLRSLNSILNGAQQLRGRRIRFIYAIKDSIFDELGSRAAKEELDSTERPLSSEGHKDAAEAEVARANRTKFFDLVIPVVPFITHRSARDLIVETMKDVDQTISTDLIDLAARHVADMRLIKNVRNEFAIFKQQIIDLGDLELDHNKLFAMMLYKSTHLSDFELIKLGKSNLDKLYRDGRGLVTANVKGLNTQIHRARALQSRSRIIAEYSEVLGGKLLKHIKSALWDLQAKNIRSYALNQESVTEDALRTGEFWIELLKSDETLTVLYTDVHGNRRTHDFTRVEIAEALGEPISSKEWVDNDLARLDEEISQATSNREFLRHADMGDLMARSEFTLKREEENLSFAQLAELHLKSGLAVELVSAGYIERNFTLYTSTFYGERISAAATNFILKNIDPNKTDIFFELSGDEVDAIIREKGQAVLRERSAYNLNVLDRLLDRASEDASILIEQLMTYGEEEREFILAYLEDGSDPEALIQDLSGKWPRIFMVLISDAQLEEEMGLQLVNSALLSLNSDLDYAIDDEVRDYVVRNYARLTAFTVDDTTQAEASRIAALVKRAGAQLPLLDPLGSNALSTIVADGSYRLTRENLLSALRCPDHALSLDAIAEASNAIYNRVLQDLPGYLAVLQENEPTVVNVQQFITTINAVGEVDEGRLPAIISRAAENCRVAELASVPPAAWPSLAKGRRFPATFQNIQSYVDVHGLDRWLANVLEGAGKIDMEDEAQEPAKQDVALTILRAKNEIPSARIRAELVSGLALDDYVPASAVPEEPGELVGHLIANDIVPDDAGTFALIKQTDIPGLVFAISKSTAFADFMTPKQVTPQVVAGLISSDIVPPAVKDIVVDRFEEFTSGASRDALTGVARYAIARGKNLAISDVSHLATERVNSRFVLPLLQPHLPELTLAELTPILNALGEKYPFLTEANGKHPSISDTEADRALANRLRALGVVSSIDPRGSQLQVHMRKP